MSSTRRFAMFCTIGFSRSARFAHADYSVRDPTIASWCAMMFFHESGHVIVGWASGGVLQSADLLPWHLPYSIFEPNPQPLFTLWGGPLLGVLIPLVFAMSVRADWMWFIANFCVLANGVYLLVAWMTGERHLDTPLLLQHGAYPATIATYCLVTIGFGYAGFRRQCILALTTSSASDSKIAAMKSNEP